MGKLAVGTVVLVSFPFSNLKGQKVRPALVLADSEFEDYILCQITSKAYSSKKAIPLGITEFSEGSLPVKSFVRPDKLFTADTSIMKGIAGTISSRKINSILKEVRDLFR